MHCFLYVVSSFGLFLSCLGLFVSFFLFLSALFCITQPACLILYHNLINMNYFSECTALLKESLDKMLENKEEEGWELFIVTSQRLWYPRQLHWLQHRGMWRKMVLCHWPHPLCYTKKLHLDQPLCCYGNKKTIVENAVVCSCKGKISDLFSIFGGWSFGSFE